MNTKKMIGGLLMAGALVMLLRCSKEELSSGTSATSTLSSVASLTEVAQTSAQLASGTSFNVTITDTTTGTTTHPGNHGHNGNSCRVDGTYLLTPTEELLAIIDAESAGDLRGMRLSALGGAKVTQYDSAGNVVKLNISSSGGQGCSFSGGQFPATDTVLAKLAKTIIDFGTGVTQQRDTLSITRAGSITITRSTDGDTRTEVITFNNYVVNGIGIEGTKTRVTMLVKNSSSVTGSSVTNVSNGKFTFADGTEAVWTSDKQRNTAITLDTNGQPDAGTITTEGESSVKLADGTVVYSHTITKTITEIVSCGRSHHGPVSGTVETVYRINTLSVDFGDGTCTNTTVTVTINGVTTTHTVKS